MIVKKSREQIEKMQVAGRVHAEVMEAIKEKVGPGVSTKELDSLAHEMLKDRGAVPSFLGYTGPSRSQTEFPGSICASINEVIVHGIPNGRKLEEGDILSVDLGVILEGWHADAAATFAVGRVDESAARLLEATEESLRAGIEQCVPGNRVSDIGAAVEKVIAESGFSVVREFVGHGIGRSLHEDPQIPNFVVQARGPQLEEGMVLAIEPMVNAGGWMTKTLADGWTVVTADGSLSAHFEHTVAIMRDGPRVLTALDG